MRHPPLIGIYSRPSDDHLDRVIHELDRRNLPFVRFDTADFPQQIRLAARLEPEQDCWQGDFVYNGTRYRLEDFRSIWYRRPSKTYAFAPGMAETGYLYAKAEAQRGFGGLLHSLSCLWVSHPDSLHAAEWKPTQLCYAQQIGFRIPRTLITNDPQAVMQFFEECQGEVIYKSFSQGVPPKIGEPWLGAIYTTKLTQVALQEHAPTIALTANLFQEYIPKAFELRINVIGSQVFAAEIHSQHCERTKIDFRMGYDDLYYRVHALPAPIEEACRSLVRMFDLRFSALDILVTPDGEYVFLELNSSGQWGWIENHTRLPLTETLVDLLAVGKTNT